VTLKARQDLAPEAARGPGRASGGVDKPFPFHFRVTEHRLQKPTMYRYLMISVTKDNHGFPCRFVIKTAQHWQALTPSSLHRAPCSSKAITVGYGVRSNVSWQFLAHGHDTLWLCQNSY